MEVPEDLVPMIGFLGEEVLFVIGLKDRFDETIGAECFGHLLVPPQGTSEDLDFGSSLDSGGKGSKYLAFRRMANPSLYPAPLPPAIPPILSSSPTQQQPSTPSSPQTPPPLHPS